MTRDTIDMARETSIRSPDNYKLTVSHMSIDTLKAFEDFARADERSVEREACAKLCETTAPSQINGYECADVIRNRGNT